MSTRQLGAASGEAGDDVLGAFVGGAGDKADPQDACGAAVGGAGLAQRRVPCREQVRDALGQCLSGVGKGHAGARASEQGDAQLSFQLPDLLGQRRLGDEQSLPGAGEVALLSDGGEVAQQPGVDIHAIRLSIRSMGRRAGALTFARFDR